MSRKRTQQTTGNCIFEAKCKVCNSKAKNIIENYGGKTSESVSKKTSAVIVGANPGSKYEKAKKLNIPILTEEEFKEQVDKMNNLQNS